MVRARPLDMVRSHRSHHHLGTRAQAHARPSTHGAALAPSIIPVLRPPRPWQQGHTSITELAPQGNRALQQRRRRLQNTTATMRGSGGMALTARVPRVPARREVPAEPWPVRRFGRRATRRPPRSPLPNRERRARRASWPFSLAGAGALAHLDQRMAPSKDRPSLPGHCGVGKEPVQTLRALQAAPPENTVDERRG